MIRLIHILHKIELGNNIMFIKLLKQNTWDKYNTSFNIQFNRISK